MKKSILFLALLFVCSTTMSQSITNLPGYTSPADTITEALSGVKTTTPYGPALVYRETEFSSAEISEVYNECNRVLSMFGMDITDPTSESSSFNVEYFGIGSLYTELSIKAGLNWSYRSWLLYEDEETETEAVLVLGKEDIYFCARTYLKQ